MTDDEITIFDTDEPIFVAENERGASVEFQSYKDGDFRIEVIDKDGDAACIFLHRETIRRIANQLLKFVEAVDVKRRS